MYTHHTNRVVAQVDCVTYCRRKPENGSLYHPEYWTHKNTEWQEWNVSSWATEEDGGAGNWMDSEGDGVNYPHTLNQIVVLNNPGAQILNSDTGNTPMLAPMDFDYTGQISRHYVE